MNISDKSFIDTLEFIVESCFLSICAERLQSVSFRISIFDTHISRLDGIRLLFIDSSKHQSRVDKSISHIQFYRAGLVEGTGAFESGDVGRSPAQSSAAVGQGSN